jgi:hypothetical protein
MKPNVTYILGAGASAGAFPTIAKGSHPITFNDSLYELADLLHKEDVAIHFKEERDNLCSDLKWLADVSPISVDSKAQIFYKTDKPKDFDRLKKTLSAYFTYRQFVLKARDIRYDDFITNLLDENKYEFPNNIRIINWNYDFQMQLAGEVYRKESFTSAHSFIKHSPSFISYFPTIGNNYTSFDNQLSMIHMNSIAGFFQEVNSNFILSHHLNDRISDSDTFFENILSQKEHKRLLISFAFEQNNIANQSILDRIRLAKQIVHETDYLVIIGYSFPEVNYKVDSQIFDVLKESSRLKRIYYQDMYPDVDKLRHHFDLDIDIIEKKDVKKFFIPIEYWKPFN